MFQLPVIIVMVGVCIFPINSPLSSQFFIPIHILFFSFLLFFWVILWCQCFTVGLSYKGLCHLMRIIWMVKRGCSTPQICTHLLRLPNLVHSHFLRRVREWDVKPLYPSLSIFLYDKFSIRYLIFCCTKHYF